MHPRAKKSGGKESATDPLIQAVGSQWWRSTAAVGLYGALAGVIATLVGTGLSTAQSERTFLSEQRADAYSEFLSLTYKVRASDEPERSESAEDVNIALQRVQLIGTREAAYNANTVFFALYFVTRDENYSSKLADALSDFRDQARADLGAGDSVGIMK